ncbi:APC family permease [Rhizomonospora bruguierae]|uniref:APC family permease n=1 Tax=Rhizomonospora bruguierae TaxID=1581705 RepID=UPI001BCCC69A|nr:APC family permease [Micromonospora sp. NBRC 107566]
MNRLARRLGLGDAVIVGLGSMLGAGVFVVYAPATAAAGGGGVLIALLIAGFVALCNATSSARLAARYPESGGTYVYGRERLNGFAGFLAGWAFIAGKTASCAAMALTVGAYLWPGQARPVAVLAVVAVTAVNLAGIHRTARATRVLVAVTLVVLVVVAGVGLSRVAPVTDFGVANPHGVLGAAGLMFFAFAGYARIATLGEEVRSPERIIPRAIPLALAIVFVVYVALGAVALAVLGPARLARSAAPLADVVAGTGLEPVVRAGAGIAVLSVLLALVAGVGRTGLAMARRGDLPRWLSAVEPRHQVPRRAEVTVAAAVLALASLGDVRTAIGFSSCTVLVYYAIANLSALTLGREPGRRLPVQALAGAGLVGCLVLAGSLPWRDVAAGAAVLVVGAAVWLPLRQRRA